MMLRGNLKQVRIEKNPARLRALESAAGESEPASAMALALAGEPGLPGPAPPEDRPDEEMGFTIDIKSFLKPGEKTYTQRCRLFVGNLPTDITEEDFKRLFERYGEPSEVFINRDRGFGFIRLVSVGPGPAARRPRGASPLGGGAGPLPAGRRKEASVSPEISSGRKDPPADLVLEKLRTSFFGFKPTCMLITVNLFLPHLTSEQPAIYLKLPPFLNSAALGRC